MFLLKKSKDNSKIELDYTRPRNRPQVRTCQRRSMWYDALDTGLPIGDSQTITGILKPLSKQQFAVRTAKRSYRPAGGEIMVDPAMARRFA
ncbi:MAG: hypothetical protein ACYS7Y_32010, partial [Planctomycetota bacterium]